MAALRDLGLSDGQILSVVGITCRFNFMNRLADGLGVDLEAERQEAMRRWVTARPASKNGCGPASEPSKRRRQLTMSRPAAADARLSGSNIGRGSAEAGGLQLV